MSSKICIALLIPNIYAIPLKMNNVPIVAITEFNPITVTINPFRAPMDNPTKSPIIIIKGIGILTFGDEIILATKTPVTPIIDPTEISKFPVIITKVVPIDIHYILDQVEKAIELKKSEQIALLNKLNIVPDKRGMEFDRIRKIISSGHKL